MKVKAISYTFGKAVERGQTIFDQAGIVEAYVRASRDALDNTGIDQFSLEKIRGMIDMLEQFHLIVDEVNESHTEKN